MTREELITFQDEIKKEYEAGKIKAPIHLSGDNEEALIQIFQRIHKKDWIFSTWRSHYHWLLSGRDKEELRKQILEGHSMHVYGDKFFTSAIVGGIAPIAVGVAWGLKEKGNVNQEKVWCFIGDGAYHCGIVQESIRYAVGHKLPIMFVLEDNGLTVRADTQEIWGFGREQKVIKYTYKRKYPHAGSGNYVMF